MATAMSLVDTIVRVGFTANLVSAWLGSFAIGVVVAAPTAILIAPAAPATRRPAHHRRAARRTPKGGQIETQAFSIPLQPK